MDRAILSSSEAFPVSFIAMSFTGKDGPPGLFWNHSLGTFLLALGISNGSMQVTHTLAARQPRQRCRWAGQTERRVCILSQGANLVVLAFSAVCQINGRKEGG